MFLTYFDLLSGEPRNLLSDLLLSYFDCSGIPHNWAAANGGVTNGGLKGVWPPFLEISRNRPKSPFFCLFRPFPEGAKSTWEIQKTEEKGLFPQISSDFLKPPSLKPPFAALQHKLAGRALHKPTRPFFGVPTKDGMQRGGGSLFQPSGHAEVQCEKIWPDLSGLNFGK